MKIRLDIIGPSANRSPDIGWFKQDCTNFDNTTPIATNRVSTPIDSKLLEKGRMEVSNYPNPFTKATTLAISMAEERSIQLELFHATGQRLYQKTYQLDAGLQQIEVSGTLFPKAGIYFYKINSGEQMFSGKMIRL